MAKVGATVNSSEIQRIKSKEVRKSENGDGDVEEKGENYQQGVDYDSARSTPEAGWARGRPLVLRRKTQLECELRRREKSACSRNTLV